MALFAFWRDGAAAVAAHAALAAEAHVVAAERTRFACAGWQLAAFATATRFHDAAAQVWTDAAGGACVLHGLPWRLSDGRALDAAALARLLDRPGGAMPEGLGGEYAVARLFPCGTLEAFGDPAGVHQLFHRDDRGDMLANRAAFLALLGDRWEAEPEAALWLAAIGYRVGEATAWRHVRQMPQATRLSLAPGRVARTGALPDPARVAGRPRGFDAALYAEGLAQGQAACRLAAGDGPLDLPVTGGKDSRAVLALALAAGLRDRLTLTTRGLPGHPDVVAAERIAATLGLPHRREPPRGSDAPPDLSVDGFVRALAEHVYQTDGGMGGWDLLVADRPGTDSLVTGHMGEVLKAFGKAGVESPADAVAMVRAQSPFDPMDLLRPTARAALVERIAGGMAQGLADGADEGELGDLFYYRNRIPNWLGGIRGVRSFERQSVMPLGVPALQRLAFLATPEERRAERLHHRIVRDLAPALLPLPFAHQRWPAALGAPDVPPLLAAADMALFGNWQWSINRVPAIRAWLTQFVAATDLPLWEGIDRAALIDRLRKRRFDYRDGIALLGLVAGMFHQAGLARPRRIGGGAEAAGLLRPIAPAIRTGERFTAPAPAVSGHVDTAGGGRIAGWAWAPDWPGAGPAVVARDGAGELGRAGAERGRADLAVAGIGDGRYGFTLAVARAAEGTVTVEGLDAPAPIATGIAA